MKEQDLNISCGDRFSILFVDNDYYIYFDKQTRDKLCTTSDLSVLNQNISKILELSNKSSGNNVYIEDYALSSKCFWINVQNIDNLEDFPFKIYDFARNIVDTIDSWSQNT